jgi:hypothetical protein
LSSPSLKGKKPKVKEEGCLSGPNIARILDVDVATVRRWHFKEGAPAHPFGDMLRFKLSEIIEWRTNQVRKTNKKLLKVAEATEGSPK